ncbi:MAG: hypothetical protein RL172_2535 [Bacteroidota bacterium]|jgi:hypothetical protein
MKKILAILLMALSCGLVNAQVANDNHFGSITLTDGTVITGEIKNSIRKNAAVSLVDNTGKKKIFSGNDITAATINNVNYLCIKGDFFKTICTGKLCFLQKESDASGKPIYNGAEAVFANGTEGKIGDFYLYSNQTLKHLNKKTANQIIEAELAGCTAAVDKARQLNGDMAALAEAITIYNNSKN